MHSINFWAKVLQTENNNCPPYFSERKQFAVLSWQKNSKKEKASESSNKKGYEMLTETFTLAKQSETELSFKKQSEKWQIAHFRM